MLCGSFMPSSFHPSKPVTIIRLRLQASDRLSLSRASLSWNRRSVQGSGRKFARKSVISIEIRRRRNVLAVCGGVVPLRGKVAHKSPLKLSADYFSYDLLFQYIHRAAAGPRHKHGVRQLACSSLASRSLSRET